MKIGIGIPNPVPGVEGRLLVDWARRAEERGFSSLVTIDRIAYPSYESLITLAAAGAVTQRIGLLTNILVAGTRNPILLAKEAASVHQISGGRLTLGLAAGGRADDFEVAGTSFEDRGERLDRDLQTLHLAWEGGSVGGSSKPIVPLTDGGVPVLIGGMTERAIRRTLRWGVGWTAGGAPPEKVGPFAGRVREAWKGSDREGEPRLVALTYFALGEGIDERSAAYIRDYYAYVGPSVDAVAESVPTTPEAVLDRLKRFEDIGIDELIFDPTVASLEQVDRLAEVVL